MKSSRGRLRRPIPSRIFEVDVILLPTAAHLKTTNGLFEKIVMEIYAALSIQRNHVWFHSAHRIFQLIDYSAHFIRSGGGFGLFCYRKGVFDPPQ